MYRCVDPRAQDDSRVQGEGYIHGHSAPQPPGHRELLRVADQDPYRQQALPPGPVPHHHQHTGVCHVYQWQVRLKLETLIVSCTQLLKLHTYYSGM